MIDGLKHTLTGQELRAMLDEGIERQQPSADRWKHEQQRNPEDETDEDPCLPEHMCENECERHEWRAEVLEFIRDHIDPSEVYRLGSADLEFGELLPPKPGWVEQQEYEERTSIGFNLERLTKEMGHLPSALAHIGHANDEDDDD
jgi:hypothetical protein